MHEEHSRDEATKPAVDVSFATKAGIVGVPGAITLGINAFAHGGLAPLGITGFALVCLAANSPYLAEKVGHNREFLVWLARHEKWLSRLDRATDGYFSQKLLSLQEARPDLFGEPVSSKSEDEEDLLETRTRRLLESQARDEEDEEPALVYRPPVRTNPPDDDLVALARRPGTRGPFLFSEVLQHFTPTLDRIYIGTLENGTHVFCRAEDLCHVALSGPTRGGKSSIMRMLLAQLCRAGAHVLILNPHYSRYILDKQEDWTPFEPYLLDDPMACRSYEVIGQYLRRIATEVLPKRLDRFAHSQPVGRPYFISLDELPSVMEEVPDAARYLGKILREGAKVGLFLIVASHDFLVKTIAPNGSGGAVRECYRSAFYTGGDPTTAKILLDKAVNQFPEARLGRGTIMVRNWIVCQEASLAFVPLVDNRSLNLLLGNSTYVPMTATPQENVELEDRPRSTTQGSMASVPTSTTTTRYHHHATGPAGVAERRRARVQRLHSRGTLAEVRAQETGEVPVQTASQTQGDSLANPAKPLTKEEQEEQLVLNAYQEGHKTGNAIAGVTALSATRVNQILNKLSLAGEIDWQPRKR